MRLVLIEWVDSAIAPQGWEVVADMNDFPVVAKCQSVGWLMKDTEKCKVVVPHLNGKDQPGIAYQYCGYVVIPTVAVTRIVDLVEVKGEPTEEEGPNGRI